MVRFALKDGKLGYEVNLGAQQISSGDTLGLVTDQGDYTKDLVLEGNPVITSGVSDYDLLGKKNHVSDAYNQIELKLSSLAHSDYYLHVQARVYAQGLGIRLGLSRRATAAPLTLKISDEAFGITIPEDATYWAQDTYGNSSVSSEYAYYPYTPKSVSDGKQFNFPLLYQLKDSPIHVLMSEANVMTGNFHASVLEKQGSKYEVTFTPESKYKEYWHYGQNGWEKVREELDPRVDATLSGDDTFQIPWRFFSFGDLNDIANQTMGENLSDPMDPALFDDLSYIQPGNVAWTWLNGDLRHDQIPQGQFETLGKQIYEKYVDFAAENGWEYQLLDEGWQPLASSWTEEQKKTMTGYDPTAVEEDSRQYLGYYSWMPDLIDYAKKKNVKLLVWAPYNDLGTAKERERLKEWKDMGLYGIKPDFFDSARQGVLKVCHDLLEDTAKYHMMINLHGISKPAGERRTFPNAITREAVGGDEGYSPTWGNTIKDVNVGPYQNTILPFIRYAIGPGDYTPCASFGAPEGNVDPSKILTPDNTPNASPSSWDRRTLPIETLPHQYAKSVVFESPLNTLADKPFAYRSQASVNENWWKKLPTAFDESVLVDGTIGELVTMARRKGDDWFIGTLSSYDRTVTNKDYEDYTLDFSKFLKPGQTYKAYVYSDNEDATALKTSMSWANAYVPAEFGKGIKSQELTVTSDTKLDLKLASIILGKDSGWSAAKDTMTTCGGAIIHLEKVK